MKLRKLLGDRTYEAAVKLLAKGAIVETVKLSDTAYYARVKDAGTKIVLYRDRDGDFQATCDCSKKPMGCKHCAAVYMAHIGYTGTVTPDEIRRSIAAFAKTSFDPDDYDIDDRQRIYEFYNYIQDKVLNKTASSIMKAIGQLKADEDTEQGLFRELWDACEGFDIPHDEWTREFLYSKFGIDFYDDDDEEDWEDDE